MVGDSLREALKNIFIRTEFRIQIQTYSLHYILLTNFPYQKLDQGKNPYFYPAKQEHGTGNREVKSRKTLEQSNIGTIQQSKEERRSEAGAG